MSNTVFNTYPIKSHLQQPMFFGEAIATPRFDSQKYPIFEKLTQSQLGYFWRPEEVSLQKDRNDFQLLRDEQQFIFTENLLFQTVADGVQQRGPVMALLPYCSLPELESCLLTWSFFEAIHSRSYTYIIKNVYPNPEKVLDGVIKSNSIINRASQLTKYYDSYMSFVKRLENDIDGNWNKLELGMRRELYKKFYSSLIAINILEGLRFYVSFACTFAFGELKLMEGSAKILSFIARDESQHLAITQHILKNYANTEHDELMLDVMENSKDIVYSLYDDAVQNEKEWAKHLFQSGSMLGLNEMLLGQYVEYIANKRLRTLGLDMRYDQGNINPLPWMQNWLVSKNVQVAPQEVELSSYVTAAVKQDVDLTSDKFKKFQL